MVNFYGLDSKLLNFIDLDKIFGNKTLIEISYENKYYSILDYGYEKN